MTNIDQFESVFRAASKPTFRHEPPEIARVLVLTDREGDDAGLFASAVQGWLGRLPGMGEGVEWQTIAGDGFRSAKDVLDLVEERRPDLVVTYRNLHSDAWQWPFSLGEHVDVLCGAADAAVLVMPHPEAGRAYEHALENNDRVLAMTDHLAGDARLINWSARFVEPGGTLFLAHLEDQRVFDRYLDAIGKLPDIDTDDAREGLRRQLLREPADYVDRCRDALGKALAKPPTIEARIEFGAKVADVRAIVEAETIDLLVMAAKDDDQLAMHGLAYPLAIELRQLPLLLL